MASAQHKPDPIPGLRHTRSPLSHQGVLQALAELRNDPPEPPRPAWRQAAREAVRAAAPTPPAPTPLRRAPRTPVLVSVRLYLLPFQAPAPRPATYYPPYPDLDTCDETDTVLETAQARTDQVIDAAHAALTRLRRALAA